MPSLPGPSGSCPCTGRVADHGVERVCTQILFNLVCWVSRCPSLVLVLAGLLVIVFAVGAVLGGRSGQYELQVFHPEHNIVKSKSVEMLFDSTVASESPPLREASTCRIDAFGSPGAIDNDEEQCMLHWCDAVSSSDAQQHVGTTEPLVGQCWLEPSNGTHTTNVSSAHSCAVMRLRARIAAPLAFAADSWSDQLSTALQNLTGSSNSSRTSLDVSFAEIQPLVLEDWETGNVVVRPLFSYDIHQAGAVGMFEGGCDLQVLCFYGHHRCSLPHWRPLGFFTLIRNSSDRPAQAVSGLMVHSATSVPTTKYIEVAILFGLNVAKRTPVVGNSFPQWDFDPDFEPANPWAQRAMYAMCSDASDGLSITQATCWIESFRVWVVQSAKGQFPTRTFDHDLLEWYASNAELGQQLWMVGQKMKAMKLDFKTNVSADMGSAHMLKYMQMWDSYVESKNGLASVTANTAWHFATSWVGAETEIACQQNAGLLVLVSVICCTVSVFLFVRQVSLTCLIIFVAAGSVCGAICFVSFVLGSQMALVEIVALVAFAGHAITHLLHVAMSYGEAYSAHLYASRSRDQEETKDEPYVEHEVRLGLAQSAVTSLGSTAMSSSGSFVGSCVFLLPCQTQVLSRLGAALIVMTLLSVLFAHIVFPAALIFFGPWLDQSCKKLSGWVAMATTSRSFGHKSRQDDGDAPLISTPA
eukprot:CAMPEP_0203889262 /NCGR_PEP_ID=MMETSP0359-20131031/32814_1 /ASSEMBLY_ACC=CAM_ASM_000338 /TAXON_ID=268821 /ORGANISM="Scrippsiella Hangoei, Strain SHTV-5" /LENGTH=696 /DNA_ID=CAMNT_0050810637 /DNA_START=74 /DNA_END=2164 /DNA_ORIENTATION=-